MRGGEAAGGLSTDDAWVALAARLETAESEHEQLALCGAYLMDHRVLVEASLPTTHREVLKDLATRWPILAADLLEDLFEADDDATAAITVVRCVAGLDHQLATAAQMDRRAGGAEPQSHWGPYRHWAGQAELRLIRWIRSDVLPVDRQDVVAASLRHHRVLHGRPGGLSWDLADLGAGLSELESRQLRVGLRRTGDDLSIAVWPSSTLPSEALQAEGECARLVPTVNTASELMTETLKAVSYASAEGAQILILPELFLPASRLPQLSEQIKKVAGLPLLTIVGLTHEPSRSVGKWLNEAVVLGPNGTELWRSRKKSAFVDHSGLGECLEPGTDVSLRMTSLGWVGVDICLDLFGPATGEALQAALPSLVLNPSLSASTSAHLSAAKRLRASGPAVVVVNRPLGVQATSAPSVAVVGQRAVKLHGPAIIPWPTGT